MKFKKRYLAEAIEKDLGDKIQSRRRALKGEWDPTSPLIILDEFHKHRKWKTWLKGEYAR